MNIKKFQQMLVQEYVDFDLKRGNNIIQMVLPDATCFDHIKSMLINYLHEKYGINNASIYINGHVSYGPILEINVT